MKKEEVEEITQENEKQYMTMKLITLNLDIRVQRKLKVT
jgi:hypothetical protein